MAEERNNEIKEFAEWILAIGDGRCGTSMDEIDKIKILEDILINDWDDPIVSICKATYPDLFLGANCISHVKERAILAPTLQMVDEINNYMMSLNPAEAKTYYSSDTTCQTDANNDILTSIRTLEFLNTIRCSGVPNHELTLKSWDPNHVIEEHRPLSRSMQWDTVGCNQPWEVYHRGKNLIREWSWGEGVHSEDDSNSI
ncbi:uncharacterized protein [Arachis hypogaea]|uniref:uncharacterized protein n=1 Tax=Arachis hypogaea TaxID=3818 RepID=UPI003B21965E